MSPTFISNKQFKSEIDNCLTAFITAVLLHWPATCFKLRPLHTMQLVAAHTSIDMQTCHIDPSIAQPLCYSRLEFVALSFIWLPANGLCLLMYHHIKFVLNTTCQQVISDNDMISAIYVHIIGLSQWQFLASSSCIYIDKASKTKASFLQV